MNTVEPRLKSVADGIERRFRTSARPGYSDPLDIVAHLFSKPSAVQTARRAQSQERDVLRQHDPEVDKWRRDLVDRLRQWESDVELRPTAAETEVLGDIVANAMRHEPHGSSLGLGILDHDAVDDLVHQRWWSTLGEHVNSVKIDAPTNLGRVPRDQAAALVLRGYANTFLQSLLLTPWSGRDAPPDITERVFRMAGLKSPVRHAS